MEHRARNCQAYLTLPQRPNGSFTFSKTERQLTSTYLIISLTCSSTVEAIFPIPSKRPAAYHDDSGQGTQSTSYAVEIPPLRRMRYRYVGACTAYGSIADDICLVRSMYSEAINHAPAITFLLTGSEMPGRPSMGAWFSYGLGSDNQDLPTFCAMTSRDKRSLLRTDFLRMVLGSWILTHSSSGSKIPWNGRPCFVFIKSKRD